MDTTERSNYITNDRMVITILVITAFALVIIATAVGIGGDNPLTVWILLVAAVLDLVGIFLAMRGIVLPGRILIPGILTVAVSLIAYSRGGLYHISVSGFPVIIVIAGLLLGIRGAFLFATFASLMAILIGYADINGISPFSEISRTGYDDIAVAMTLFFVTALVLRTIIIRLTESIKEAEAFGASQEKTNIELKNLQGKLEERVAERTAELEHRAAQLEAISSVARSIASVQSMDSLLPSIAQLASEKFGFYHVGIFLLDENREFALLRATNSEGGQKMLNRQHKLKLDANSIVGYVTSRGEPRIALDVGTDSVFFNNPDLPNTRSELALPLLVGDQVIGALDVQSTQPNAFRDDDLAILTTLADQVAIAIENSRSFGESQKALLESQGTFEKYVKQEWGRFTRQAKQTSFVYDGKRVIPLDVDRQHDQKRNVIQTGRLSLEKVSTTIAIPIKLRGQTIGMLDVRSKSGQREWTQDEITLLEAAAERAALALENARLVEGAQRRAARERAIGEISARIGTFSDMSAILQTAVEELGRKIGGATEVTIELGEDDKQENS